MTTRPAGELPAELTSFVGRRAALAEVKRLLSRSRLVTLTGVAGVGKSRLAVRVARDVRRSFPDGVRLVDLSAVEVPERVGPLVRARLGVSREEPLAERLAGERLLLVLDGCEFLVQACGPLVAELLAAAPQVRVLVTSQRPLGIAGEQVWPVPPMRVAREWSGRDSREALELFAERAAAVLPGFALDESNEGAVARLCQELDGLPLAIELAALWTRTLSVPEILDRLGDRFGLLTGGNPGGEPGRSVLRSAVERSYRLCSPAEQLLWARASVFDGGFELRAAESVCVGDGLDEADVLPAVAGLVDKSVLVRERFPRDRARYRLLRTMREFGRRKLAAGELFELRRRHRDHCSALVQQFSRDWFGEHQRDWVERIRSELPNLRAALDFCLADPAEHPRALRLVAELQYFWLAAGELVRGRRWLQECLDNTAPGCAGRGRALQVAALVRGLQGDATGSRACWEQAEQAGAEAGARWPVGLLELLLHDYDRAEAALGAEPRSEPAAALLALLRGEVAAAERLAERAQAWCSRRRELWLWSWVQLVRGLVAWQRGEAAVGLALLREGLRVKRQLSDAVGVAAALELVAVVEADRGDAAFAAPLLFSAGQWWEPVGGDLLFGFEPLVRWHAQAEAGVREVLSGAELHAAQQLARRFALADAVRYALREPAQDGWQQLTPRECEVARLVAQGLSNRQIAEQLVISKRTSDSHVEHILAKLGFSSRAQIAVWVAEQV